MEISTWSGMSTRIFAWSGIRLPTPSWSVSQTLVEFWTKRRNWEIEYCLPYQKTKDVTVISDCSHYQRWAGEPRGNSGCENTGYWPQITEVHIKGMISVNPNSCIFPYIGKSWIPWLEISSILWLKIIFWLSDYLPFVAKLLYILAPPSPPWSSSLRVTWDAASWASSPKNFCRVKHLSTFRFCV